MAENRQRGKSEGGVLASVQGLQTTKVLDEKRNLNPILFHFEGSFVGALCSISGASLVARRLITWQDDFHFYGEFVCASRTVSYCTITTSLGPPSSTHRLDIHIE